MFLMQVIVGGLSNKVIDFRKRGFSNQRWNNNKVVRFSNKKDIGLETCD
jgi:hypothetical protein